MSKGAAIPYSEKEISFLSKHRVIARRELTQMFNDEFNRNLSLEDIRGVCKRNKFFTGRNGHFKKGETSWNKGKTGEWGANATSFKKGEIPHNSRPIGSETCYTNGYVYVKVGYKDWRQKQRLVYEKHHGPLPEDSVVRFRDGDSQNFEIENLKVYTRYEHLYLNRTKHEELPEEFKLSNELLAKLEGEIYKRSVVK